jgi:hypothetical protein
VFILGLLRIAYICYQTIKVSGMTEKRVQWQSTCIPATESAPVPQIFL